MDGHIFQAMASSAPAVMQAQRLTTLPDVVLAPGTSVVLGRDAHGLPKTGEFKKISKEQCRVTMGAAAPWRVMVERLGLASTRVGTDDIERDEARECKLNDAIVISGKVTGHVLVTYTLAHS